MPDTPPSWRDRLVAASAGWWPGPSLPAAPTLVAIGLVAVVVVGVVVVAILRPAPAPPELTLPRAVPEGGGPESAEREDAPLYVHAAGAVGRPGVYRVRAGARVADVVDAAGGPTADADLDQLNLAAKVSDGERVYVPRRGEAVDAGAVAGALPGAPGPVAGRLDLNAATLDQLESLPGVGPATASAIVEYRKAHGRFKRVEELLEVRGIGEAKLAAIRSKVRV